MMIRILFVFIILNIFNCYSQQLFFESELDLSANSNKNLKAYPIYDKTNKKLSFFLMDKSNIRFLQLDSNFNSINRNATIQFMNYDKILGGSFFNDKYYLYFLTKKSEAINILSYDAKSKSFSKLDLAYMFEDFLFVESLTYKNNFFVFALKKSSSILKIIVFDGLEVKETQMLDFTDFIFEKKGSLNLYGVLSTTASDKNNIQVQKINLGNPNPLDLTSKENKLYEYDGKAYITLDNEYFDTKIIIIDLNNFTSNVSLFEKGKVKNKNTFNIKSNSYLHDKYLFQVKSSKIELNFSIHDISNNSLIKEYKFSKKENVNFKNTSLIQEGGAIVSSYYERAEILKTSEFLQKLSSSLAGVSVYQIGDIIEVTIGGHWEPGQKGQMMISPSFGSPNLPFGNKPKSSIEMGTYNPEMYGYLNYINSRTTYFITLFESNTFNKIITKRTNLNALDKIKIFTRENASDIEAETVIKIDNSYIFGYYDKEAKNFYLRKFLD